MQDPPPPPPSFAPPPLPPGWTEHRAPTGHTYYYNANTNISTYTRPILETSPSPSPLAVLPPTSQSASLLPSSHVLPARPNFPGVPGAPVGPRQTTRPPRRLKRLERRRKPDRPKKKRPIPGAEPWLLVTTKKGRKFVHNPETKISLWMAPKEVQEKVDAMPDEVEPVKEEFEMGKKKINEQLERRMEIAKRKEREEEEAAKRKEVDMLKRLEELGKEMSVDQQGGGAEQVEESGEDAVEDAAEGEEQEEEEEEEESDDDDGYPSKRAKTEGPVEYTEDDITWQLQAMQDDYGLDDEDMEDGEEYALEDGKADFMEMLTDKAVNPYSTWDATLPSLLSDPRYTSLPSTKHRKEVFTDWCTLEIARLKAEKEKQKKIDPRIPFWVFLKGNVNPKLYWAEFKRKWRKESEMKNSKLGDREREKMYREFVSRSKLSAGARENDLKTLLKATPQLSKQTALSDLPDSILIDARYVTAPDDARDRIIRDYLSTLPDAPLSEEERKAKEDWRRRQIALREREEVVRRDRGRQRFEEERARDVLREEEAAVERAMRVGKRGLLSHVRREEDVEEGKREYEEV